MWRVNVPNPVKVAITRFQRPDAERLFAVMHELSTDPLSGSVYRIGANAYYRVIDGYLIFFDLVPDQHVVNVTAIERPH